jgi:hypothetical protein
MFIKTFLSFVWPYIKIQNYSKREEAKNEPAKYQKQPGLYCAAVDRSSLKNGPVLIGPSPLCSPSMDDDW